MERFVLTFLRFFSLSLVLSLSACQSTVPEKVEPTSTPKPFQVDTNWQHQSGEMHCFPVSEAALARPVDDLVLPVAPGENLWPRIQAGLAFDFVDHKSVQQQLDWYRRNPAYMKRVQQRSRRYLYHVVEVLHAYEIPLDVALLPIIESAYEPFAYSHGQASGLWQFIPMTGDRFKLKRNWWQDERRNVDKSAVAAAKYLRYLHRYFDGDWQLAVAAYNAGEGNVRKAVRKNQAKNLAIDFFSLDLPKETTAYVPKLIALAEIIRNPEKYNVELLNINNEPYYQSVMLDSQLDLAQAAKLLDLDVEELYYLNPGLNRWATPPSQQYALNVPFNKAGTLKKALSQLPKEQRVNWHRHTITSGDSLSSIAVQYNSSIAVIKDVNNMSSSKIVVGHTLMIPTASISNERYQFSQSQREKKRKTSQPKGYHYKSIHVVKAGESFWVLSQKYKQPTKVIAKWNAKSPKDTLRVGEHLVIWHKTANVAFSRDAKLRKVHYSVRRGDSLASVASKFNVRVAQIVDWNPIDPNKFIQPGQRLTIYVNISETF